MLFLTMTLLLILLWCKNHLSTKLVPSAHFFPKMASPFMGLSLIHHGTVSYPPPLHPRLTLHTSLRLRLPHISRHPLRQASAPRIRAPRLHLTSGRHDVYQAHVVPRRSAASAAALATSATKYATRAVGLGHGSQPVHTILLSLG